MRSLLRLARTLVAHGRLEVDKDRPGDVPSRRRFAEERVEGVVGRRSGGPSRRLALLEEAVGGDSVLQAVQLPALVPRLDAGLPQVNRNAFYQVWSSSNTRGIDSVRSGERTHQRSEQGEPQGRRCLLRIFKFKTSNTQPSKSMTTPLAPPSRS
jgi:hypothetical protein